MKQKLTLYLLMIAFLLSASYKTLVWVDFLINRQYIENNLCINRFDKIPVCKGSCYLDKQVSKTEKQEQKFPDLKVKEIALYVIDKPVFTFLPATKIHSNSCGMLNYENLYVNQISYSIFHPPKQIDFIG
jgi:hypothetical protein